MKRIVLMFLSMVTIGIYSCNYDNNSNDDNSSFESSISLDSTKYQHVIIEDCSFDILKDWMIHKQSRALFFSSFNNDIVNHYFAILKVDISSSDINEKTYILNEYKNLLKDTSEVFTGYTLRKITFKNQEHCYLGEFFSKNSGEDYLAYFLIFSKNGNLFHLVLKTRKSESPSYKNIFRDIILSFQLRNEAVFTGNAEIENNEIVDISKNVI